MRIFLFLLAAGALSACSADQFATVDDAGGDVGSQPDVVSTDGSSLDAPTHSDGAVAEAGPPGPQLLKGIPGSVDLFGVWGTGPSDFWVVGGDKNTNAGFVGHWTGSFANVPDFALVPVRAVWGNAGGVFFAGDLNPTNNNNALAVYAPQGGTPTPLATSPILGNRSVVSVWYDEANALYALQTDTYLVARSVSPFTTSGDIGTQIPSNAGPCFAMHARFAACAGGVYGPGATTPQPGSTGLNLRAIHVTNPTTPSFAVAGEGGYLARDVGSSWQTIVSPTSQDLEGIWSTPLGDGVAVGTNGTILTMTGLLVSTVSVTSLKSPNSENLHAVTLLGAGANRIFVAVGDKGTVVTDSF